MKAVVNQVSRASFDQGLALFIIRVMTGLIFFIHGAQKWQDIDKAARLMDLLGFGGGTAYFLTGLEVFGGIALMLGIATRFFGLLFGIEMLVAVVSVGLPAGFQGYEFELLLSIAAFSLALGGSGKFSLYKMQCDSCGGMLCTGQECESSAAAA